MRAKAVIVLEANSRFSQAREFWGPWRTQAMDDYAFVAGNQWLEEDKAILEEQKRPPITFNYSEKMIDAVVGAEVSNRQEVRYLPRGVEDAGLSDLWNAAAKYVRDECNAEDEETDAFRDMLICGLGWTRTRLDYESNPDGDIRVDRVDPMEMYPDPAAVKAGLVDRRFHFRLFWAPQADVKRQWPKAPMVAEENNTNRGTITHGQRYDDEAREERERHKDHVQLRFYEWYDLEDLYRVQDVDGQLVNLSAGEFKQLKPHIEQQGLQFVKMRQRVYYFAWFAGETLLEMDKSPCQDGWMLNALTGKRDRNKGTWYGLTRVMKDPQRWANKWLSQILHIINSNAKGGLLAEIGAFVDPQKAQDEWSSPDSVTMLNEGGLKKIQEKQQSPYPTGLDKLMEFALGSLPMVTGINLEALGLANREQAGVLEAQRKQAAYGLLSPMFDSLRRYRKDQGRVLLYFIRNYIADGRLIRLGGPENVQFLPLTKDKDAGKYDIVVDQAPTAPDTKQRTWDALVQILPAAMKAGMPIPPDVLDFTPLPTSLSMKWKQFIGQQQQVNEEAAQEIEQLKQENQQLKVDKTSELIQVQQKAQAMQEEMQLKRQAMQEEMKLKREQAIADFELEQLKMTQQQQLEENRLRHEQDMRRTQLNQDFTLKAFQAGVNPDEGGKFVVDVDTSGLTGVLDTLAQTNQQMLAMTEQGNAAVAEAMQQLMSALSRPRKLVLDASGKPVGSMTQ